MLESKLEHLLFTRVRALGGIAVKLAPIHAGVPDRLVLLPEGRTALIELKTETGRVSPIQQLWHDRAATLGHTVIVLHGQTELLAWLEGLAR